MSDPDRYIPPRTQVNQDGVFVGRDNYGTINTVMDTATKEILKNISNQAPQLGNLLTKAIKDGLISPDVAVAIQFAAHNINADVAEALALAGKNINSSVAESISNTSHLLSLTKDQIAEEHRQLSGTVADLREEIGQLDRLPIPSISNRLEATTQRLEAIPEYLEAAFASRLRSTMTRLKVAAIALTIAFAAGMMVCLALAQQYNWSFK